VRSLPDPSRLGKDDQRPAPPQPRRQPATNAALYLAVIVRMRWHQPTIDYVARRTAERLSKADIIRVCPGFG